MKKYGILVLAIFLLWSCKNGGEDTQEIITYDEPIEVEFLTPNEEVLKKLYSADYWYPADFSYEKNLDGSIYYENTRSTQINQNSYVELHSNDKKQARTWSGISNNNNSQFRQLISERETEKYFEFKRVEPDNPKGVLLSRVHKSSYFIPSLDKTTFDAFSELTKKEIGILKQRPITMGSTSHFIEYLWSTGSAGFQWDKVLETKVIELPNWFQYNLKSIRVITGDIGSCDEVEIWEYNYFVHKRMGNVYFNIRKLKEFKGKC